MLDLGLLSQLEMLPGHSPPVGSHYTNQKIALKNHNNCCKNTAGVWEHGGVFKGIYRLKYRGEESSAVNEVRPCNFRTNKKPDRGSYAPLDYNRICGNFGVPTRDLRNSETFAVDISSNGMTFPSFEQICRG